MSEADDAYRVIFEEIAPEAIAFFKAKSRDYSGPPTFMWLGSKGQFVNIDRKHMKLFAAVWEGRTLEGEQPEEIVMDFIGHALLMLFCLRREAAEAEATKPGTQYRFPEERA